MADAYVCWKYPDDPGINPGETQHPLRPPQSSSIADDLVTIAPSISNSDPLPQVPGDTYDSTETDSPTPSASVEVEILVIDIYTLLTSIKISCTGDQTTASTLVGLGYVGNAPFHPSVAISIKTLELYRIIRRRKPSFSVEAFVKVVCDLYMVCVFFIIYSPYSHCNKDSLSSQVSSFILRCI